MPINYNFSSFELKLFSIYYAKITWVIHLLTKITKNFYKIFFFFLKFVFF